MAKKMRVALCQLLVEGGEPERNLERARVMVEQAAALNCDLALLPETLDLAWTHPSAFREARPIPGPRSAFFAELAAKHGLWLCLGLTESDGERNYNAAVLLSNEGKIVLKHRKINLLEVEFPFYAPGRTLAVAETPLGAIGVDICADNYPEALCLGHSLARMGAAIILAPSSWTVDYSVSEAQDPYHDKWLGPFSRLASLYEIPVAAATSVGYIVGGPYVGRKMVGCSLAVQRDGRVTRAGFNEFAGELVLAELELGSGRWQGVQFGEMLREKDPSALAG